MRSQKRRRAAGWAWTVMLGGAFVLTAGQPAGAGAEEAFSCELKQARGLDEDDAWTASELLCAELRHASSATGGYEVSLASLGRLVVVTVRRQEDGVSITVRTEGVEEIPAAPRIARALAEDRPLADTQRVGNLLAEEAQPIRTKPGELKFLTAVANLQSPGLGSSGASVTLGMMYAGERFSLPLEARVGWGRDGDAGPSLNVFSASVGGRGYLTNRDVSPYLGVGLGLLTLDAHDDSGNERFRARRIGFGTYLEAGVEVLRLHRARVALAVRADIPTYSLHQDAIRDWQTQQIRQGARTKYVWPVSIGVSVAF